MTRLRIRIGPGMYLTDPDEEDDDYAIYGDGPFDLDVEREAMKWRAKMSDDQGLRRSQVKRADLRPEQITEELLNAVAELMGNSRKIEAIQLVRTQCCQ